MSVWKRLCEAVGIRYEAPNWSNVAKKQNMQRWGTQDRRQQVGPTAYFNPSGTGAAQRQATMAAMTPSMTPAPGGVKAPMGQDRPGQTNPLYAPPKPKSPLTTAPNSPQGIGSDDEEDESAGY